MALFGKRASELEYRNRLLLEVDKKRIERIESLEVRLNEILAENLALRDQYDETQQAKGMLPGQDVSRPAPHAHDPNAENSTRTLLAERDFYRQQLTELERQHNLVIDAATRYSLWAQELDRLLAHAGGKETERKQAWASHVESLGVDYRSHAADATASD